MILAPYHRIDSEPDLLEPQDMVPTPTPTPYNNLPTRDLFEEIDLELIIADENRASFVQNFDTEEHDIDLESLDDRPISFSLPLG